MVSTNLPTGNVSTPIASMVNTILPIDDTNKNDATPSTYVDGKAKEIVTKEKGKEKKISHL